MLPSYEGISKQHLMWKTKQRGIQTSKHLSCKQLIKRLQRHDYGLLIYEEYIVSALRRFAAERGLVKAEEVQRMQAGKLVPILKAADEHADLSRFADLPPELRLEIFEWYFAGVQKLVVGDGNSTNPKYQPPLTRTCRWIRKEAMPVFLKGCKLHVSLSTVTPSGLNLRVRHPGNKSDFQERCSVFALHAQGTSQLHLEIVVYSQNWVNPKYTVVAPMKKGRPVQLDTIQIVSGYSELTNHLNPMLYDKAVAEQLLKSSKEALQVLSGKPGNESLELRDFEKAFEDHSRHIR